MDHVYTDDVRLGDMGISNNSHCDILALDNFTNDILDCHTRQFKGTTLLWVFI